MPDEPRPPFEEPDDAELPALIEALLFVADGPAAEGALSRALGVTPRRTRAALDALEAGLGGRGVRLQRGPEGVQLVTAPTAAAAVEHFLGIESGRRLSTAALETLAVVAYRQPVTRAAIEAIRGTSSDGVLATLRARGLVERVGRADGPGRPALYGATQRFLEHFGLARADDLPGFDELTDGGEEDGAAERGVQAALPLAGDEDDRDVLDDGARAPDRAARARSGRGGRRRRTGGVPSPAAPALPSGAAPLPRAAAAPPPAQRPLGL